MKTKMTGIMFAAAALAQFALSAVTASAVDTITVNVTISNAGTLTVPAKPVQVRDRNEDGKFDLDEALYAVHETYFEGGAEAGYLSKQSDYGLSLYQLWGVDDGVFGYYVNHQFAMNLSETVEEGDSVAAFVYADSQTWSDSYCYFDQTDMQDVKQGEEVSLMLHKFSFGADGSTAIVPVSDAVITVDGEKTAYQTDENGAVKVKLDKIGEQIISAVSDTEILVPTVLRVTVSAAETSAVSTTETTAAASSTTSKKNSSSTATASKAGESAAIPALALTMALAGGTAFVLRRRHD